MSLEKTDNYIFFLTYHFLNKIFLMKTLREGQKGMEMNCSVYAQKKEVRKETYVLFMEGINSFEKKMTFVG